MNRLELLQEWQTTIENSDKVLAVFDQLAGPNDGPLRHSMYTMQSVYTRALELAVGDEWHWLEWYACENDFGKKDLTASSRTGVKRRKIKTLKQLMKLIDESNKQ